VALFLRAGHADLDYTRVHEIRRVLEIEIAGLAAERRIDEDLARLEGILAEMAAIRDNRDRSAQNGVAFHSAPALYTHRAE
jgi:DNA-binding FadR family transcriptional regulator